jgi:hypothetical protein
MMREIARLQLELVTLVNDPEQLARKRRRLRPKPGAIERQRRRFEEHDQHGRQLPEKYLQIILADRGETLTGPFVLSKDADHLIHVEQG